MDSKNGPLKPAEIHHFESTILPGVLGHLTEHEPTGLVRPVNVGTRRRAIFLATLLSQGLSNDIRSQQLGRPSAARISMWMKLAPMFSAWSLAAAALPSVACTQQNLGTRSADSAGDLEADALVGTGDQRDANG
jgi:hypothetical protein